MKSLAFQRSKVLSTPKNIPQMQVYFPAFFLHSGPVLALRIINSFLHIINIPRGSRLLKDERLHPCAACINRRRQPRGARADNRHIHHECFLLISCRFSYIFPTLGENTAKTHFQFVYYSIAPVFFLRQSGKFKEILQFFRGCRYRHSLFSQKYRHRKNLPLLRDFGRVKEQIKQPTE